jgi:glycosyltransferase involved in cell wall biosynthesis
MRIAFIHNKYIDYRINFFELLSQKYNVTFYFEYEKLNKSPKINLNFSETFKIPKKNISYSPLLPLKLLYENYDLLISGDLGYTNTVFSFLVSKAMNKPFIIWTEEWHPKNSLHQNRFKMKRIIVMRSDACIAAGSQSASFLRYLGAQEKKIFIAPNASIPCLDNRQIDSSILPEDTLHRDMIKILFLGRIIPSKGLDHLIKAFRLIEKKNLGVILIIAGEGSYLAKLENLVKREKIKNVVFLKHFINHIDKVKLYQECDILVLPSVYYGYVEAWGLVLNEVMYFGKPVVATEIVGAAYDLIKNGMNGYIVPEKNVEALSEALMKIISDDRLRKSLGQMSKKIIEQGYKVSDMVNGFKDAIDFVLSGVG